MCWCVHIYCMCFSDLLRYSRQCHTFSYSFVPATTTAGQLTCGTGTKVLSFPTKLHTCNSMRATRGIEIPETEAYETSNKNKKPTNGFYMSGKHKSETFPMISTRWVRTSTPGKSKCPKMRFHGTNMVEYVTYVRTRVLTCFMGNWTFQKNGWFGVQRDSRSDCLLCVLFRVCV